MAAPLMGHLGDSDHADIDIAGTAIQIGTAGETLYQAEVDNRDNTVAVYFKIWISAAIPNIAGGGDEPTEVYKIPASTRRLIPFNMDAGLAFATGVWVACVTTAALGAAGPTNNVTLRIRTNST